MEIFILNYLVILTTSTFMPPPYDSEELFYISNFCFCKPMLQRVSSCDNLHRNYSSANPSQPPRLDRFILNLPLNELIDCSISAGLAPKAHTRSNESFVAVLWLTGVNMLYVEYRILTCSNSAKRNVICGFIDIL